MNITPIRVDMFYVTDKQTDRETRD